jgi:hypothetical protein
MQLNWSSIWDEIPCVWRWRSLDDSEPVFALDPLPHDMDVRTEFYRETWGAASDNGLLNA